MHIRADIRLAQLVIYYPLNSFALKSRASPAIADIILQGLSYKNSKKQIPGLLQLLANVVIPVFARCSRYHRVLAMDPQ